MFFSMRLEITLSLAVMEVIRAVLLNGLLMPSLTCAERSDHL